ncbi:hypothetical protein EXIGLDRAFT_748131 [Exidia glandulosa HHB12029]|uniref:Uncharacterized protein n=1 Tax=Exidia glandulosa HHB12029 TaxID=1314781 RepID=A0A165JXC0_EXIGL|nr:hypothetical protein EXIGLDRAFT_748131 [Exidia glandulosa HHB12029]
MGNACSDLGIPDFPVLTNSTSIAALNDSLSNCFGETFQLPISRDLVAELYCATSREGPCYGICPNADLAGLGVRLAFYFQAALNALLVGLSPEDSPGAAWGATLLTAAIVIPAMVQKKELELSLYHATLVLNFTTLSSLASLAVAPLCPIWREKGLAEPLKQRMLDQQQNDETNAEFPFLSGPSLSVQTPEDDTHVPLTSDDSEEEDEEEDALVPHHAPSKKDVTYQRIVLSMALLAQVALQWAYAVFLFTSPYFAEKSCSATTVVVLFGVPFRAAEINEDWFGIWVLWLVFNMGVTFIWGAFLVISGAASKKHSKSHRQPGLIMRRLQEWDPSGDKRRKSVMAGALLLAVSFLAVAEVQQRSNCFAQSENDDWGFGQVAALLLVLVPIWQIVVVLNNRWFGGVRDKISNRWRRSRERFLRSRERVDERDAAEQRRSQMTEGGVREKGRPLYSYIIACTLMFSLQVKSRL